MDHESRIRHFPSTETTVILKTKLGAQLCKQIYSLQLIISYILWWRLDKSAKAPRYC